MISKARGRPAPKKTVRSTAGQKRSRGRPGTERDTVGREAIVIAARQLLNRLPPHKVPTVLVARKAGVDPALVRYYFPKREGLLIAVVEHIFAKRPAVPELPGTAPSTQLSALVAGMLDFSCNVRFMQRLMIDECAKAKSPAVRARVRELNYEALRKYAEFFHLKGADAMNSPEPLFMHIAIIGLCEFFAAAQPMILPVAPKHLDASQLARRYKEFICKLVLDGVRSRLDAKTKIKVGA